MVSHYFFERAVSVGLYVIVCVIISNQISLSKLTIKQGMITLTGLLAIMAYFIIPAQTMDLYRLWITASDYSQYSFVEMARKIFDARWSSPLGIYYVSAISKINPHLLPAITALWFYGNISYIISDYSKKHDISNSAVAAVIIFFLSRGVYGEVISGIRSMLAFSIIAKCIYDEIYNKKGILIHIPVYVALSLFHSGAIAAIVIYLFFRSVFIEKGWGRIVYAFIGIVTILIFYFFFNSVATRNLDNVFSLFSDSGGYFYGWEFLFNTIYMLIIFYILRHTARPYYLTDGSVKMRRIAMTYFVIAILSIRSYSVYHRFISFASFCSLPVLIEIIEDTERDKAIVPRRNVIILAIIMFVMSGVKGNLNGIKFFIW